MTGFAALVALILSMVVSCAWDVNEKEDPVHCSLEGIWCNCTGTVDTAESLDDAQGICNQLRAQDGGN